MIVDAHHHLWQIGRNGHAWPTPDLAAIHRDFEAADLARIVDGTGVTSTILVQTQTDDRDTDWMLDIAADSDLIAGVVGWVDMAAPEASARIRALAQRPKFKGLRPMLQGLPDDNWILRPEVRPALLTLIDEGLSLDALVFTRHLPVIDALAKALPNLSIVIDHGAKPPFATPDDLPTWRAHMETVAQNTNIACKLSGLFTELMPGQSPDEAMPAADHLLACFGPDRLMWGSDWPVVDLAASYRAWLDWTRHWLENKTSRTQETILSGTARAFYRLAV